MKENIYSNFIRFLVLVWFVTFPVQGVFYQASIYLIPLMGTFNSTFRENFYKLLCEYWKVLLLIVLPVFLSFIINVIPDIGANYKELTDIPCTKSKYFFLSVEYR